MKVTEITGIENDQTTNYSIIWFVVEEYPDKVIGLKSFPNAMFKKDYIVFKSEMDYYKQVEMVEELENEIAAIKEGIGCIIHTQPDLRVKLLHKSDEFL
ncbi:hypothetical protein L2D08_23240 [Domibacillus sp. PGB-M46]|uniref:hypothetical protein n=1 Tax=Domibacillus sp. PGB-M46 TaxID=2910255 RepID=UPI001F5A73B1|nr:hypothetical protein [Domibacillus sp. PGB-M46]MCI2257230.1 hypothetical protein [Domibacillus sp. PGB-M46]